MYFVCRKRGSDLHQFQMQTGCFLATCYVWNWYGDSNMGLVLDETRNVLLSLTDSPAKHGKITQKKVEILHGWFNSICMDLCGFSSASSTRCTFALESLKTLKISFNTDSWHSETEAWACAERLFTVRLRSESLRIRWGCYTMQIWRTLWRVRTSTPLSLHHWTFNFLVCLDSLDLFHLKL